MLQKVKRSNRVGQLGAELGIELDVAQQMADSYEKALCKLCHKTPLRAPNKRRRCLGRFEIMCCVLEVTLLLGFKWSQKDGAPISVVPILTRPL